MTTRTDGGRDVSTWEDTNPRFVAGLTKRGEWVINDMDFGYDAQLKLSGDFVDSHAENFARAVADVLNRYQEEIPVPPENYGDQDGLL